MDARGIEGYGGPYNDFAPTEDPQSEMAADFGNRLMEDAAQLTQTGYRAIVSFTTLSGGAPPVVLPAGNIRHWTMWGSGSGTRPTITKTAQGLYAIQFASSYVDGLGESENVNMVVGHAAAEAADVTDWVDAQIIKVTSTLITLRTYQQNAAPPVLHDVGNSSGNPFDVTVWLR